MTKSHKNSDFEKGGNHNMKNTKFWSLLNLNLDGLQSSPDEDKVAAGQITMRSIQWLLYLHQEMTIGQQNIHLTIAMFVFPNYKNNLFRFRYSLKDRKDALTKFLVAVDWTDNEVKHPKLEKNPKWRNICSKLRNKHENNQILLEIQQKSLKN